MQRIDAQAAIVGKRGQAGKVRRLPRFQIGIVGEGDADLVRLGQPELVGAGA